MARRSLPVLVDRFEDASKCGPCGGKCCRLMPGIAVPEDFGAPDRDTMRSRLRAAFETKRWAIDWWEGDPREGSNALDSAEFVRPATRGKEGTLFDPSWGGTCTFLGPKGCELAHDDRPRNCRGLVPNHPNSCAEEHSDGERVEKVDYVLAWIPYLGLLLEVAGEVDRAA